MGVSSTPKLLTVTEAAELLRTTPAALIRRCRAGDIRASKPFGSWLIPTDAIDELLAKGYEAQRSDDNEGVAS